LQALKISIGSLAEAVSPPSSVKSSIGGTKRSRMGYPGVEHGASFVPCGHRVAGPDGRARVARYRDRILQPHPSVAKCPHGLRAALQQRSMRSGDGSKCREGQGLALRTHPRGPAAILPAAPASQAADIKPTRSAVESDGLYTSRFASRPAPPCALFCLRSNAARFDPDDARTSPSERSRRESLESHR
jgi:hypothetical protein